MTNAPTPNTALAFVGRLLLAVGLFVVSTATPALAGVGNYVSPGSGTVTTTSGTITLTPPAGFGCSANAGDPNDPTQASTYFAAASVATSTINFNWGSAPTSAPFVYYVRDQFGGVITTTGIQPQGNSAPFPVAVPILRLRDLVGNPAITTGQYKIGVACYNANTGAIDGTNYAESPIYVFNVTASGFSWAYGTPASAATLGTVNNGDTTATVAFTVPAASPTITAYTVSVNGATRALTSAEIANGVISLTGLTNGTVNPVTLSVSNGVGPAAVSNSVNVSPTLSVIAGLSSLAVTGAPQALNLSWTNPASPAPTGYSVAWTPTEPIQSGASGGATTISGLRTTYTIPNLVGNQTYSVTLTPTFAVANPVNPPSVTASGTAQPTTVTPPSSAFHAVSPKRLFDSRPDSPQGEVPIVQQRYGGATVLKVKVTGAAGVPTTGVGAVSLNVTAIDPLGPGFVTVYPCGVRPLAANLNYVTGQIVPNAVIAPVSDTGEVCFYSLASTHLVADVAGWFASSAGFNAVSPKRLFDSRPDSPQGEVPIVQQRYGGATVLKVKVTGAAGVPISGVGAVSLNVTVIDPLGPGFVTVFPCGSRPTTANLNYVAGQIVPNAVIAPVSADGEVCFYSLASTHLVADVSGWFASGTGFAPLSPMRLFDTRPDGTGIVPIIHQRYGQGNILKVKVTGAGIGANVVPTSGVGAVSLNVTAVAPDGPGFVTVFPCGDRPLAANLNYVAGQVVPNAVIAPVSADGEVCFYSLATTDLVADVSGWFSN